MHVTLYLAIYEFTSVPDGSVDGGGGNGAFWCGDDQSYRRSTEAAFVKDTTMEYLFPGELLEGCSLYGEVQSLYKPV